MKNFNVYEQHRPTYQVGEFHANLILIGRVLAADFSDAISIAREKTARPIVEQINTPSRFG